MKRSTKKLKSIDVSKLAQAAGGQACPNGICPPARTTTAPTQTWGEWFASWF
jgi:hypothetical protein